MGADIAAVGPSRRPLRGLLRMTIFLHPINGFRHAEERPREPAPAKAGGASRSTQWRHGPFDPMLDPISTRSKAGVQKAPPYRLWISRRRQGCPEGCCFPGDSNQKPSWPGLAHGCPVRAPTQPERAIDCNSRTQRPSWPGLSRPSGGLATASPPVCGPWMPGSSPGMTICGCGPHADNRPISLNRTAVGLPGPSTPRPPCRAPVAVSWMAGPSPGKTVAGCMSLGDCHQGFPGQPCRLRGGEG